MVGATNPVGGLADLLHRGQEQPNEDRDNRDHYEQFDQCECRRRSMRVSVTESWSDSIIVDGFAASIADRRKKMLAGRASNS